MRRHVAHLGPVLLVLGLVAAATPLLSDYHVYALSLIGWLGIMAVSFDVLMGFTGYLSLAHGALFGVGAYGFANFTATMGVGPWPALLLAGLVTLGAGTLIASLAFRTRGLYFAVLTLGIGLVGFELFIFFDSLTGGLNGFAGIPGFATPSWFAGGAARFMLLILIGTLAITYLACYAFTISRAGRNCLALREDATLARALGIRVSLMRLMAFAISAFFAGIAGALYAAASNFVGPDSFSVYATGFQLLVLTVVGGMATLWGPLLGAVLLTVLDEALRSAQHLSLLIYGVLLLVMIAVAPGGIAGLLQAAWRRLPAGRI